METEDKPIITWSERSRQRCFEQDLRDNYYLLKPYLLQFGGKCPVPDLVHHEASGLTSKNKYIIDVNMFLYIGIKVVLNLSCIICPFAYYCDFISGCNGACNLHLQLA